MSTTPQPPRFPQFPDDPAAAAVDPLDETLVAYLDGELEDAERRAFEDRLLEDPQLRQRMRELQSGWEMLDQLPQPTVTEDFARTTVEMVAAGQSQILLARRRARPWRSMGWMVGVLLVSGLLAAAGYAIPTLVDRARLRQSLRDLPLAEHLDAYQLDVDLDLMARLSENDAWNSAMQFGSKVGGINVPRSLGLSTRDWRAQVDSIEQLDREAQVTLASQWERLQSLPEPQLQQVRQRYDAIRRLRNPEAVLRTMEQYAAWWNQLTPEDKNRIFSAPPQDKMEAILSTLEASSRSWVRNYGSALGDTDRKLIYDTLIWVAKDRIEQAKQLVDDRAAEPGDRWEHSPFHDLTPERLLYGMAGRAKWHFLAQQMREQSEDREEPPTNPDDDGPVGREASPAAPPPGEERRDESRERDQVSELLFGPLSDAELQAVEEVMSPKALFVLGGEAGSEDERRSTLFRWCVEIILQSSPGGDSPEAVLNRYQSLDHEFRDLLDLRPPDEIFNELRARRRPGGRRRGPGPD